MIMSISLSYSIIVPFTPEALFSYFEKPDVIYRLAPPWEKVRSIHKLPGLQDGDITHVKMVSRDWIAKITQVEKPNRFTLEQIVGPFENFKNEFIFESVAEGQTKLSLNFIFTPKGGRVGQYLLKKSAEKRIQALVNFRFETITNDLLHKELESKKREKIILAGGSGFVGSYLKKILELFGYEVKSLVRKESFDPHEVFWDPDKKVLNLKEIEGAKAIINLCGESIFSLRWTQKKKKRILTSRINPTEFLAEAINSLDYPPKYYLVSSAIGFYGDRQESVTELSSKGVGFLSDVVAAWEEAAQKCTKSSVVHARFGVVFGPKGGILKKLATAYRFYLGAQIGADEKISWISLDDLGYQILFILKQESPCKIYNITSNEVISNKELSEDLSSVLGKKVFFKIPKWLIKLICGEASTLFISSCQAYPKNLLESGAKFSYPNFKKTLHHYFLR